MRPLFRAMAASAVRVSKSEEYLRSLIASASDVITVLGPDGNIVYESPAIERVLGFSPSERIGRSVLDAIHRDDRTAATEALVAGFREPGTQRSVTLRMRAADGAWHVIEATGRVEPDPEGTLLAIVNSRDVTGRRAAEAVATRLGHLLDRSLNEIYLFDTDTLRFEFVNEGARRNLGYTMEELRRLTPLDIKPESIHGVEPPLPRGDAHVLFVDDEDAIVRLGREMLESLGYRVTTCPDASSALAAFRSNPAAFDLVVTDQTMPGMTGIELSSELQRLCPSLPILLTTGFSEGVGRDRVRRLGIRDLLLKPYRRRDLGLAVDAALHGDGVAAHPQASAGYE